MEKLKYTVIRSSDPLVETGGLRHRTCSCVPHPAVNSLPLCIVGNIMSVVQWSEALELGVASMDDIHKEFIVLLQALVAASDEAFLPRLDAFAAHCEEHFGQESIWMMECGFPPIHCHEEEHDKVTAVVKDVRRRVASGDLALGRTLARELTPWFEHHAATMDTILATYMQQQRYDAQRDLAEKGMPVRSAEPEGCCQEPPVSPGAK